MDVIGHLKELASAFVDRATENVHAVAIAPDGSVAVVLVNGGNMGSRRVESPVTVYMRNTGHQWEIDGCAAGNPLWHRTSPEGEPSRGVFVERNPGDLQLRCTWDCRAPERFSLKNPDNFNGYREPDGKR